jgi:hypothetical protein
MGKMTINRRAARFCGWRGASPTFNDLHDAGGSATTRACK